MHYGPACLWSTPHDTASKARHRQEWNGLPLLLRKVAPYRTLGSERGMVPPERVRDE